MLENDNVSKYLEGFGIGQVWRKQVPEAADLPTIFHYPEAVEPNLPIG